MATLTVTASHNYTGDVLGPCSDIAFSTAGFTLATFSASQFSPGSISPTVHIAGDANSSWLTVNLDAPGKFSAKGWTFGAGFDSDDTFDIQGTNGVDTIVAGTLGTLIVGGGGADKLTGGAGGDLFRYFSTSELVAGETVSGHGGNDGIQINCDGGVYDFSHVSLSGIENLYMNYGSSGGSGTAILSGSEIGSGGLTSVSSGSQLATSLIVRGAAVDLSGVEFDGWTDGVDDIAIKGTRHADRLTGSGQSDAIGGGNGRDRMTGGDGNDAFRFDGKLLAKNADHITDFAHGQDHIQLDQSIFTALSLGALSGDAFHSGSHVHTAADQDDRLIYDTESGKLFYDKDGTGSAHAKLIATLDGSPDDLSFADFLVIV